MRLCRSEDEGRGLMAWEHRRSCNLVIEEGASSRCHSEGENAGEGFAGKDDAGQEADMMDDAARTRHPQSDAETTCRQICPTLTNSYMTQRPVRGRERHEGKRRQDDACLENRISKKMEMYVSPREDFVSCDCCV